MVTTEIIKQPSVQSLTGCAWILHSLDLEETDVCVVPDWWVNVATMKKKIKCLKKKMNVLCYSLLTHGVRDN